MRQKDNYVRRKLDTPKKVTLPNGHTFVAQYKHVFTAELPANITIRRRYTQRAVSENERGGRGWQRDRGIFDFVRKVIKNPTVRANKSNKK